LKVLYVSAWKVLFLVESGALFSDPADPLLAFSDELVKSG